MSYLKLAACAAMVASTLVSANVAFAGNGGVSAITPGKTKLAVKPVLPPGQAAKLVPGTHAIGIGQNNPNKPNK